jgi:hypothetical protein
MSRQGPGEVAVKGTPVLQKARHVIADPDGGWQVRRHGASRATRVFADQGDAVAYARRLARKHHEDLFIHRRDGTVERWDRSFAPADREAAPPPDR